ncbi:MAG: hypothetical protein WD032_00590 [Nitrospirales bacterium]
MEMMTVVSGVVVLVLAYAWWVWWKAGHTPEPMCGRVRHRIRTVLGAVSREEMHVMNEHIQARELQLENRLTKLETAAKFSHQLHYVSKEIDRRLTQLERAEGPQISLETEKSQQPRSLVRLGVRVTLSDGIWAHLGTDLVGDIENHLIDAMVQGPFCPVCLKRVAGRDRHTTFPEVPAQCRYCGISWEGPGTIEYPLSIIDLKRQVYQQLDQEIRSGKTMY